MTVQSKREGLIETKRRLAGKYDRLALAASSRVKRRSLVQRAEHYRRQVKALQAAH